MVNKMSLIVNFLTVQGYNGIFKSISKVNNWYHPKGEWTPEVSSGHLRTLTLIMDQDIYDTKKDMIQKYGYYFKLKI